MTTTKTHIATLAAAMLTAIASGCGGSSSNAKPLTRADLTAKASAICRRVLSEVDWAKVAPQDLPRLVGRLAALEEQASAELDKLVPPASLADEWRLIVDDFKATGPELKEIAERVRVGGPAPFQGGLPLSEAQHERGLAANIMGIKDCAKY
jgi:hypothetical protein